MNETIAKIWNMEMDISSSPGTELTKLIDQAQIENGSDDLSDLLFDFSEGRDLEKLIYILDVSAWCGTDNGSALHRNLESWLIGNDENKIYIALNVEAYPFIKAEEMYKCLTEVSQKFPQFKERCEYLTNSRKVLDKNA